MNDNTQNTVEQVDTFVIPAIATDIRIIEGNDTDGELRVIEVASEDADRPVDVPTSH